MKPVEKYVAIFLLLFSIGFNLWLYRAEPTTTIDPNDNAFQYALVDRTNQIWDYANRTCSKNILFPICHISYLTDHWVPNWAQGYNLPYYYSHIPQIIMVGSYRLFAPFIGSFVTLFEYYHLNIYVLLCFFPLSMFLAFRILKFPWLTAGIAALLASQISTDGLYGIDQSSFLWRGWGLSSQLFALIWLPLAVASIIEWTKEKTKKLYILSILFLTATTVGHLGIGMMAFLTIPVICITPAVMMLAEKKKQRESIDACIIGIKQTLYLALPPIIILSYWIIPAFLNNNYHNISFWDPVWKFDSFGAKEAVTMFVGGQLFDFSRFPLFTLLLCIGACAAMISTTPHLAFLFFFFFLLFFGRTTWGGLLNIIPGMSEFHQHRFLVGVHLAGLFLIPIGLAWIIEKISTKIIGYRMLIISLTICILAYICVLPQTIHYAQYNTQLITQGNAQYVQAKPDFDLLLGLLRELQMDRPGRVYALRGTEGKEFHIASTPYYMHLSTYGIPIVLWLPETWSMNSDTEQFFVEENPAHYTLYNIRYVVAPPTKQPQPFWKLIKETPSWKLYTVETNGYIAVGTAPSVVTAKKTDIVNLVHLWIQSDYPKQGVFPELSMKNTETSFPQFRMTDPNSYKTPDGMVHNLFSEIPVYIPIVNAKNIPATVVTQSSDTDMVFTATVKITTPCPTCVVVLKQTYHPNWHATVNGKPITPIIVFPFYVAVRIEQPGTYNIIFSYR
jgi:hypothetical protein